MGNKTIKRQKRWLRKQAQDVQDYAEQAALEKHEEIINKYMTLVCQMTFKGRWRTCRQIMKRVNPFTGRKVKCLK